MVHRDGNFGGAAKPHLPEQPWPARCNTLSPNYRLANPFPGRGIRTNQDSIKDCALARAIGANQDNKWREIGEFSFPDPAQAFDLDGTNHKMNSLYRAQ